MILAGLLSPIEEPLTSLLEWLHSSIGLTWAWAIVVLTVLVRMVILPLTIKQIRSMQRLQQHAPALKALQQKYKGDRQRLNEEVMKFYKENKINPASSCLPIFLQIPIFISLFYVLRDFEKEVLSPRYPTSDLGWLSVVPDITDPIKAHWSGWLLIVIYGVSQVASIYYSMSSATAPAWQRYMFMILPVVFIPVIVSFPTGLMLYWSTTNLWTVGQGFITRRLAPKPEAPPKRTSRAAPKPREDGGAPDGAKPVKPPPKPGTPVSGGQQQRVRRRKKKGPQAGRRR